MTCDARGVPVPACIPELLGLRRVPIQEDANGHYPKSRMVPLVLVCFVRFSFVGRCEPSPVAKRHGDIFSQTGFEVKNSIDGIFDLTNQGCWSILIPSSVLVPAGMNFTILGDNSILTGGTIPSTGDYSVVLHRERSNPSDQRTLLPAVMGRRPDSSRSSISCPRLWSYSFFDSSSVKQSIALASSFNRSCDRVEYCPDAYLPTCPFSFL